MAASGRKGMAVGFLCLLAILASVPLFAQEGKKYGKLFLKEYQPKNEDEASIIQTLMQLEGAFNSHDLQTFVSSFTKDAAYRPCGAGQSPIASKACQDRIKLNFVSFMYETYYDPEISIDGDKAAVKLRLKTGGWLADYTAWLQKAGKVWLITKNDYENEVYKGD